MSFKLEPARHNVAEISSKWQGLESPLNIDFSQITSVINDQYKKTLLLSSKEEASETITLKLRAHFGIYEWKNIKKMTFTFSDSTLHELDSRLFGHLIRNHLTGLQELTLNLNDVYLWEYDSESLANSIGRNLRLLRQLRIHAQTYAYTNPCTFATFLAVIMRNLFRLQVLELDFYNGEQINDKAIELIAEMIGKYQVNLKELKIEFGFCRMLTDKGLIALASKLFRKLVGLRSLDISLDSCYFTERGFTVLAQQISKHLVNLEFLKLNCSENFAGGTGLAKELKKILLNIPHSNIST